MAAHNAATLANSICHDPTIFEDEAHLAQPSPPWGALPAEQYLIVGQTQNQFLRVPSRRPNPLPLRNWDWASPLPAADQTCALVRAFLALDDIPEEWDATPRSASQTIQRVPIDNEIRTILRPWRPLRYRDAAYQLWTVRYEAAVWLRKYYGEGSDEKFAAWRAMDEDYDPNFDKGCLAWTVLSDPEVFDLGDEWWRVFDLLPELTGPNQKHSRRPAWGNEGGCRSRVHLLLVADARAWETDCLRVLFLDAKGNIVRYSTVNVPNAWYTRCYWINFRFNESPWWVYAHGLVSGRREAAGAELGEKYHARGELGRSLYGLEP